MKQSIAFTLIIIVGAAALGGCTGASNQTNSASAGANPNQAGSNPQTAGGGGQIAPSDANAKRGNLQFVVRSNQNPNQGAPRNPNDSSVVVEALPLFKLSADELDRTLGAPPQSRQDGIGGDTIRTYLIKNGAAAVKVTIGADKKIKTIQLNLAAPRQSSNDLFAAVGLDPKGLKPDWENGLVKKYDKREIGGIKFRSIDVSQDPTEQAWNRIELEVAD